MWQLDLYGFRPILSDTFVIFGSVYYAHTEGCYIHPWFGRVVECRLLRSRVQTYVRQSRKYMRQRSPSLRLEVNQVKDREKEGD